MRHRGAGNVVGQWDRGAAGGDRCSDSPPLPSTPRGTLARGGRFRGIPRDLGLVCGGVASRTSRNLRRAEAGLHGLSRTSVAGWQEATNRANSGRRRSHASSKAPAPPFRLRSNLRRRSEPQQSALGREQTLWADQVSTVADLLQAGPEVDSRCAARDVFRTRDVKGGNCQLHQRRRWRGFGSSEECGPRWPAALPGAPLQRRAGGGSARRVVGMDADQFGVRAGCPVDKPRSPNADLADRMSARRGSGGAFSLGYFSFGQASTVRLIRK